MSKIKKYVTSTDFLTSDLQPESCLIQNLNKKYLKDISLHKNNKFIEVNDLDIQLLKKNNIVFYPYNIKLIPCKGNKVRIPIFLETPSLLTVLLHIKKIKFIPILINDIQNELTEKEREYYYQEKTFINMLIKN